MTPVRTGPTAASLVAALALGGGSAQLAAQSLDGRIAAAPAGEEVRLSFAARPGVLGDGERRIAWDCGDGPCRGGVRRGDRARCEPGPVRVRLTRRDGVVVDVDTYGGGAWPAAPGRVTDLGTVSAPEAARFLLDLARRDRGTAGGAAILPAALADSIVVWPTLLAIARDDAVPRQARRDAIFWIGQAAERAATDGLTDLLDRPEAELVIQEAAVFALSQRPAEEGVPVLIQVARAHRDPRVRRAALFWLAQSGDRRAVDLFEEILTRS